MELEITPELRPASLFRRPRLVLLLIAASALLCSAFLAWQVRHAMTQPDEMSYRFQARILRTGRLRAPALPGATWDGPVPQEVHFNHHISTPGGWSVMYPIGWPMVLAMGQALGASWLVTPLLGVLLVWLTYRLASALYDEHTGAAAALLLVPCPWFFMNTSGDMPHALAACMIAAGLWAIVLGLQERRPPLCAAGFLVVGLTLFVHPFTALGVSAGLAVALVVFLRGDREMLFRLLPWLLPALLLVGGLFALQNGYFTHSWLRSPYALSAGTKTPPEVTLNPRAILAYGPRYTASSLLSTVFYATPFLFLLAGYAMVRLTGQRRWSVLLASVFVGEVCMNNLNVVPNISLPGQRMYFEGLAPMAVLAGAGLLAILERWRVRKSALYLTAVLFGLMQALQYGIEVHDIKARVRPSLIYRDALAGVHVPGGIVFMRTEHMPVDEGFASFNYNVNDADWPHAPMLYLIDPGPARRSEVARRFGRARWVVVTYDGAKQTCDISPVDR
ncbi:MAG TPA: glycosyltransferase family 39 protein [Bryobacteraceae bacterium]|nr:glycosyltransferase family 39 protein [Bryobacteraceae bacterium]